MLDGFVWIPDMLKRIHLGCVRFVDAFVRTLVVWKAWGAPLRRMYPLPVASSLLNLTQDALRKKAVRGKVASLSPKDPQNPLRSWLFDAEELDRSTGTTSEMAIWLNIDQRVLPATPDVATTLVEKYRDQLELTTAEAFAEREARLIAEREIVVQERDSARRELDRIVRTFTAVTSALLEDTHSPKTD